MAGTIMDKFLIAPFTRGLQSDLVPFMLPEDAFTGLNNMYIYKGKVKQRPTPRLLNTADAAGLSSRLKMNVGTTDLVTGNLAMTAASFHQGTVAIGQQFTVDGVTLTVWQANGDMKTTNPAVTGTCNVGTKVVNIVNATPGTPVYWYPSTKVMHISAYNKHGDILEFAFDQEFAYRYDPTNANGPGWIGRDTLWTDSAFYEYQTENYFGALGAPDPTTAYLFIAKYTDPVRYYNSTTDAFVDFIPNYSNVADTSIRRCKVIKQYEGRLFLMNTVEYAGTPQERAFKNRIRYSEGGNVFAADSWYESTVAKNKGGFYDLPVNEEINCAEILNDRLIIFCKNSIYELVPSGNPIDPFLWNLIDSNVGAKKNSVAKVANSLLFVNNFGIYVYDGKNVNKIDQQIADTFESAEYRNGNIYNDVDEGLVYIPYAPNVNDRYPTRAIIYNYINNTFSLFDDYFMSLGILGHSNTGVPYNKLVSMIGTHQGYTLLLTTAPATYKNGISCHITNVHRLDADNISLTIYNHNLVARSSSIRVVNSALNGLNGSYHIQEVIDANTVRVTNNTVVIVDETTYTGDANVLTIDTKLIATKQFNPYMKNGYGLSLNKIAFNVNRTTVNGKLDVYLQPNGAPVQPSAHELYPGDGTLDTEGYDPLELRQGRVWHNVCIPCTAESVAIVMSQSLNITLDDNLPFQQLTINAIMLYTEPAKYI